MAKKKKITKKVLPGAPRKKYVPPPEIVLLYNEWIDGGEVRDPVVVKFVIQMKRGQPTKMLISLSSH